MTDPLLVFGVTSLAVGTVLLVGVACDLAIRWYLAGLEMALTQRRRAVAHRERQVGQAESAFNVRVMRLLEAERIVIEREARLSRAERAEVDVSAVAAVQFAEETCWTCPDERKRLQ